jgi:hypothetical protein
MAELKKQDKFKVAVVIDGSSFITAEEGILHESISGDEALLLIKTEDGKKEVKIKITK